MDQKIKIKKVIKTIAKKAIREGGMGDSFIIEANASGAKILITENVTIYTGANVIIPIAVDV